MTAPDPYSVLGVGRGATAKEVRTAYRDKCLLLHPDRRPSASTAAFQAVQAAWEVLRDESTRRQHDATVHAAPVRQRQPRYQREVDEAVTPTARSPQTAYAVPIVCAGVVSSGAGDALPFALPAGSEPSVRLYPSEAFASLPANVRAELLARIAETALPPASVLAPWPTLRRQPTPGGGAALDVVGHTYFTLEVDGGGLTAAGDSSGASSSAEYASNGRAGSPPPLQASLTQLYGVFCLVQDAAQGGAGAQQGVAAEVGAVFALSSLPLHALMLERLHGFCQGLRVAAEVEAEPATEPAGQGACRLGEEELRDLSLLLGSPCAMGEPEVLPELMLLGDRLDPLPLLRAAGAETLLRTLKLLLLAPRLLVRAEMVRSRGWRSRGASPPPQKEPSVEGQPAATSQQPYSSPRHHSAAPPPAPHLCSSAALCLASMLPNGLVPFPPPPPLKPSDAHRKAPSPFGPEMRLLPSVSHWDVFRLLPHTPTDGDSSERRSPHGWLAGVADPAGGRRLAPLAQAELELHYRPASDTGGATELQVSLCTILLLIILYGVDAAGSGRARAPLPASIRYRRGNRATGP